MPLQTDERLLDKCRLNKNCAKCLGSSPCSKSMLNVANKMDPQVPLKALQNLFGKPSKPAVFPLFRELMASSVNAFSKTSLCVSGHVGIWRLLRHPLMFLCASGQSFSKHISSQSCLQALSFCLFKVTFHYLEFKLNLFLNVHSRYFSLPVLHFPVSFP